MDKILDFLTKKLVDKAAVEIDKNGIPDKRKGTGYTVLINNKNYPFKLLVTEAAKLAKVKVTSNDFGSNSYNRKGFVKLTNYPIIDLSKKMTFKNLKELVNIINTTLGSFCSDFQYKRKELLNMKSASDRTKLFTHSDDSRDWVINSGGGTEFQYHLFLRDNSIGYGLGFNTQYVPFANKKKPIEYIQPFVDSFLSQPILQQNLFQEGFGYIYGDENKLKNLGNDEYILIGKEFEIILNNQNFELSDASFQEMINDLKNIMFQTYTNVLSNMKTNNILTGEDTFLTDYINLLQYKKQIILQGPPGTGKTRLAKQIASQLCNIPDTKIALNQINLSSANIAERLKNVPSVQSATGRTTYRIKDIKNDRLTVVLESNSTYEIPFKGIIAAYNSKLWEGGQSNGFDPYNAAIAKYLFENKIEIEKSPKTINDFALIQFHPSYTYEDFVRGISVSNNENGDLVYNSENKVFAEYAHKALVNYRNHNKESKEYSKEIQLNEYFSLFIDKLEEDIDAKNGFLNLTNNVGLINIEADAFRYKGKADGWVKNGNRMLFKDIKQAFLDDNIERQDLKKNPNLSGLAKQHASYFIRVLNLFYKFLNDNNLNFKPSTIEKEPLKNFVLIIDEINRANLSSVLGELIYALEYRNEPVDSMYEINGDRKITIPPNLFIIGTMNTADRSVGQIDYAIRRRFAFADVLPKILTYEDLNSDNEENDPELFFAEETFKKVAKLFITNENLEDIVLEKSEHLSDEFQPKDVWVGHSYFIHEKDKFNLKLKYEIKPLLREYAADGILIDASSNSILKVIEEL